MTGLDTPTGRYIGTWPAGSPEWHAARRPGVTGSEIAAVLGLSKWESPFSLWHRKRGLAAQQPENEEMKWGKLLEPVILAEFQARHPELAVTSGGTYRHTDHTWQLGNPDGIARPADGSAPACIVEVKTSYDDRGWGEAGTDHIPVYYRAQVLWYLDTLGLDRALIPVLISGSDYREYQIVIDPADQALADELAHMRGQAATFLESIRLNQRPDIDAHTATLQVIREMPDGVEDIDVEISRELADRYTRARAAYTAAEQDKRRATAEILDLIGTGRRAVCLGETVATRAVRDGRTHSLQPARTPRSAAA